MTVRSLSEAAADVLARSQSSADKEPMHTLAGTEVQDLGGATIEKPEGNDVGRQAAAKISQAAKPGPAPKLGAMPMTKVAGAVAEEVDEEELAESSQLRYSGSVNDKEYTIHVPAHKDLGDYSAEKLHSKIAKENPHLEPRKARK